MRKRLLRVELYKSAPKSSTQKTGLKKLWYIYTIKYYETKTETKPTNKKPWETFSILTGIPSQICKTIKTHQIIYLN